MYSLSMVEHFDNLRSISATVKEYLATKQYMLDLGPDDYTPKGILFNCYDILVDELREIGITIGFPYEGDLLLSGYVYLVMKYIEDIPQLLTEETANRIETCLNDTEPSMDMFATIREIINSKKYEHVELDYVINEIYNSDKFISFMKEQLAIYRENKEYLFSFEINRATRYLAKIRTLREYAKKYTKLVVEKVFNNKVNKAIIVKLLSEYDLDKISPENINIYSVVDNTTVPPSICKFAKQKMHEHHERAAHHIEYWIDPNKYPRPLLTPENLILLVVHHVEPDKTEREFVCDIEDMIERGVGIFTPTDIETINKIKDCILDNWGE